MTLSSASIRFPEMKMEADPLLPNYWLYTASSLGLGLATLLPPKNNYYDCWFNPQVLRRQLDKCTDPNCPLLLNATYLTVEARQEKIQTRRDAKTAELKGIMKEVHELKAEAIKDQSKFKRKFEKEKLEFLEQKQDLVNQVKELEEEKQEFLKQKQDLADREKELRERELSLEQQERLAGENESCRKRIDDMAAHQHDQTRQDSQDDLPYEHASIEEGGPNAFGSRPWIPARTPSFTRRSPATSPPTSPPPIASSPPSSPIQSPSPQAEIPTHDAANILFSCIKCTEPDSDFMIACQNGQECVSRKWGQGLGGIHSGSDAWFHISHLGMTEADFNALARSEEAWYCPRCQIPMDKLDRDKDTMTEPRSPRDQQPLDKFELEKLRRQAETHPTQKPTATKRCRQAETHDTQKPTTAKLHRRARTPKPKESTNSEKGPKTSNRRKQVLWTNPLERAALIDAMRTVIFAHNQTEQRYETASQLMLARGFDRSRYQIKNKWNRAVRAEAQRQGVPEDRHEKTGMKLITGVQDPADRKRKRPDEREAKAAADRVAELALMEWDVERPVEEIGDAAGEQEVDEEEEGSLSKRQRLS